MEGFAYACALVLAAAFVRAGAAKLARPSETSAGFGALGVPAPSALARIVPVAELALAAALLAAPRPAAIVTLAVLAAFTAIVLRAIRAGATAPCNCFGAVSTEPVSSSDVFRNVLLGGAALGALGATGPTIPSAAALALMAAAVLSGFAVLRILRR